MAGALSAFAFAPDRFWPLAFAGIAVLVWAVEWPERNRQAFANAFMFGAGLYVVGVNWIYISLHHYGGMSLAMAVAANLLANLWMALWLAAAAFVGRLAGRLTSRRFPRLLVIAVLWALLENAARAELPLGVPWLSFGQTQAPDGLLAAYLPVFGAHGTSVAIAVMAACAVGILYAFVEMRRLPASGRGAAWKNACVPAGVLLAYLAGVPAAGLVPQTKPGGDPIGVSLLQGNVPQEHKWVAANRAAIMSKYERLAGQAQGRLVVMPETALPVVWQDMDEETVQRYRANGATRDGAVIVGVFELNRELRGLHNSAVALGAFENVFHRKVHLAPFGEYIPFGSLFTWVADLLAIPHSRLAAGDREGVLDLPLGKVLVAICYEDAFPRKFVKAAAEAGFMVNMTNAAWFRDSRMLGQHLQISQARALESGREMVRSTNTGMTAHIDHKGRLLALLPPHEEGILEAQATARIGKTPYVEYGSALLAVLVAATLAIAWVFSPRK